MASPAVFALVNIAFSNCFGDSPPARSRATEIDYVLARFLCRPLIDTLAPCFYSSPRIRLCQLTRRRACLVVFYVRQFISGPRTPRIFKISHGSSVSTEIPCSDIGGIWLYPQCPHHDLRPAFPAVRVSVAIVSSLWQLFDLLYHREPYALYL